MNANRTALNLETNVFRFVTVFVAVSGLLAVLPAAAQSQEGSTTRTTTLPTRIGNRERCFHAAVSTKQQERLDRLVKDGLKKRKRSRQFRKSAARTAGSVSVPVVVHVISSGDNAEQGNISDAAIESQLAAVNEAFGGVSGGAPSPFIFVLAGVTRTVNAEWALMSPGSTAEAQAKAALHQGGPETLNLYLADPQDGLLGWATFPWTYPVAPTQDGVVISYKSTPGGSLENYNEGDTAAHEIGHWLGLLHTFQGGCAGIGDAISDTASEASPTDGCPVSRDSCPRKSGADPIHNLMDYSFDWCMFEFTTSQAARMDVIGEKLRGL